MLSTTFMIAVLSAVAAASPIKPDSASLDARADQLLGPSTCGINGEEYQLDLGASPAGAAYFATWISQGAEGRVDIAGNFKGQLAYTHGGITYFACDYKSGNKGSIITSNLVTQVLQNGGYLDNQCGTAKAGYESSNDLIIGRTFDGDHYCD